MYDFRDGVNYDASATAFPIISGMYAGDELVF